MLINHGKILLLQAGAASAADGGGEKPLYQYPPCPPDLHASVHRRGKFFSPRRAAAGKLDIFPPSR